MATGGDGYVVFRDHGTDQLFPGDLLLDVVSAYITAHQPVAPTVDGRVIGPT